MSNETREVLLAARNLITDKDHWCQDVQARDEDGEPVPARSLQAVQWCAVGALERASGDNLPVLLEACNAIEANVGSNLDDFNDTRRHDVVLDAFDKTIERISAT